MPVRLLGDDNMTRILILTALTLGLTSCTQYESMVKYNGKLYISGNQGALSRGFIKECTRTGQAELSCQKVQFPNTTEQLKEGRWTVWNTTGQRKLQEGEYRAGKHCGNWFLWDENGIATSCVPSTRNTQRLNPRGLEVCADGCSPTLSGMMCQPCR